MRETAERVLSVIVVNWNTRDLLARCLDSVYATIPGAGADVWVVDNASSDGSASMVRERHPQVRLLENVENVGFGRANNQAMRLCRGGCILLLNPDAQLLPGATQLLVECMDRNPTAGAVGPQLLNEDGSLQESWARFPGIAGELPLLGRKLSHRPRVRTVQGAPAEDDGRTVAVDWVTGACFLVRRTVVDQVGGFNESYWLYTEETEWCYRMWQAGWEVLFLPEARVVHRARAASNQQGDRSFLQYYRSRFQFVREYRGCWEASAVRGLVAAKAIARMLAALPWPGARARNGQSGEAMRRTYRRLVRLCAGLDR